MEAVMEPRKNTSPDKIIGLNSSRQDSKPGQSMDRKIEKQQGFLTRRTIIVVAVVMICGLAYFFWASEGGRVYNVSGDRITVSAVVKGNFEDFIPVRGRVIPARTVYLDTVEGGRVEKIYVEDGARVAKGQILVDLGNTALQLDVISREAQVTEQLNNLKTIELSLEQNRLSHKRNLIDIDYQVIRLTRVVERRKQLAKRGNVSQAELDNAEDELAYYKKRRAITIESQISDERMQRQQMTQLTSSTVQLEKNLIFARKNLENLQVRAPVAGKLTAFDAEIGQSMNRGQRLGQIDDPGHFKVMAQIDEFYLGRVDIGQKVQMRVAGVERNLKVKKTYPQVRNGQFEVDMTFNDETPTDIRRGQTLQGKLYLGDTGEALVIPNGSFYADTGGAWIFVLSPDGSRAVRRPVKLGRRNTKVIEVLDGLQAGEKVITSAYSSYLDMDRLELSDL